VGNIEYRIVFKYDKDIVAIRVYTSLYVLLGRISYARYVH
jgi:hypothetical protein